MGERGNKECAHIMIITNMVMKIRETDRQTDRQTETETERQRDRETET